MSTHTTKSIASEAGEVAESIKQKSKETCCAVGEQATDALACARDTIRKNPIPCVAGAFAFGIAIGCLIVSGNSKPTLEDRYLNEPLDHAVDALSSTLNRLRGTLKFW